ncbi:MAG: hypothetical protein K1X78_18380 [Verrucomicrobiaceae bacterium]|nr:hypothetical protein [Verrucomicrobiaceae bacterium]
MKLTASLSLVIAMLLAANAGAVDFKKDVLPVLNQKCSECHSASKKVKGKFDIGKPGDYAKHVKAGQPDISGIVLNVTADDSDDSVMPPKGKNRMTPPQIAALKQWIQDGASFTGGGAAPPAASAGGAPTAGTSPTALKWTNTAGASIEATFEGLEGSDFVLLKVVSTGIVHKVPLASLSPESQTLAKNGGK